MYVSGSNTNNIIKRVQQAKVQLNTDAQLYVSNSLYYNSSLNFTSSSLDGFFTITAGGYTWLTTDAAYPYAYVLFVSGFETTIKTLVSASTAATYSLSSGSYNI